jgi:hypothetical protein
MAEVIRTRIPPSALPTRRTLDERLFVRQRDFSDWDEAIRAAGITTAAAR